MRINKMNITAVFVFIFACQEGAENSRKRTG